MRHKCVRIFSKTVIGWHAAAVKSLQSCPTLCDPTDGRNLALGWPAECDSLQQATAAKSLQLCLTLCDPIDGSPPGSPVPGILQARTLEWVAISFSISEK